jgi:hypothetical protein
MQFVGQLYMPDASGGEDLLGYFFEFGPSLPDGPVSARDVLSWGEALGIEWQPWQTRLFVRLSREYCAAQHEARPESALPPWPPAVKMWRWVENQKRERALDEWERDAKPGTGKAAHGNRK